MSNNVQIKYGLEPSFDISNNLIISDIFWASTNITYILGRGASYIIPVERTSTAFSLKQKHPEYILAGEDGGYAINGFDLDKSPTKINSFDFQNKIVVYRSSRGIKGLLRAKKAKSIAIGSFLNLSYLHNYISNRKESFSILALDGQGSEDELLAEVLTKPSINIVHIRESINKFISENTQVKTYSSQADNPHANSDIELAFKLDCFKFIPHITNTPDGPIIEIKKI